MEIINLLTVFGLGSVVTALVQVWFSNKRDFTNRRFSELKESYIGLLEAYLQVAVEPSDSNSKHFAYWRMRCELVAPAPVVKAIADIIESNDNREGRNIAHEVLKIEMRKSLKIAT